MAEGEEGDDSEEAVEGEVGGFPPVADSLLVEELQGDLGRGAGGAGHLSEGEEEPVITPLPTIRRTESPCVS